MKQFKRPIIVIGILVLLLGINLIPTLSLNNKGMKQLQGVHCQVFFEKEEVAAQSVFQLIEAEAQRISQALGIQSQVIPVYVFDHQMTMQTKKYGYISSFLQLNWYIGDNRGSNVLLTSPANPGEMHSSESVLQASLHELVHAYNHLLNPKMSYWLDNGLAGYLSNQIPQDNLVQSVPIPSYQETKVYGWLAPLQFAGMGGYEYSYTYVEYLASTYPWEQVVELVRTGDYEASLGVSEFEVYQAWVEYLTQ